MNSSDMVVGARELVGAAKGFHAKAERIEDQSQPKRIAQLLHIGVRTINTEYFSWDNLDH